MSPSFYLAMAAKEPVYQFVKMSSGSLARRLVYRMGKWKQVAPSCELAVANANFRSLANYPSILAR